MTTYSAITSGQKDAESYIDTVLAGQWADNLLAIQEGDATAPKIQNKALAGGVNIGLGFLNLGDESDGAITHSSTGNITNGIYQCTNFTINTSVTMTLLSSNKPLVILCTGTCTITGTINANSKGATGGTGGSISNGSNGSAGVFGGSGGGGGGATSFVGGAGGDATDTSGGAGGSTIDGNGSVGTTLNTMINKYLTAYGPSPVWTANGGSGGGGGASDTGTSGGAGGKGGGSVIIIADTINFTGAVNANGGNGGVSGGLEGDGGGGAGGLILMVAKTWSADTGSRTVTAGIGGTSGGGNGAAGGTGTVKTITF